MPVILRVAWRNVWRNRRRTAIVVSAVSIGIAGVVLSMALNFGMVAQMVRTAIATDLGHVQIHAAGFDRDPELAQRLPNGGSAASAALARVPEIDGWAARVRGEGLANSPQASTGVRVVGVQPESEARVTLVRESLVEGEYVGPPRRALLGRALARRLQVETGDKIVISVQDLSGDLTGGAWRVGGLFRTASEAFDRSTLFLRIDEAQELFGLGDAVSEIAVVVDDTSRVEEVGNVLGDALGPDVEVRTWKQLQPVLVYLVDSFDAMAWYTYGAVFVAMAFGIANVLLMAVHERTRELGVLMSLGMRRRRVVAMVLVESLLTTGVGLLAGYALTFVLLVAFSGGIDLGWFAEGLAAYGIGTRIVPVVRPGDLWIPFVVAMSCAVLSSLWPAWRAARLRPAEAVRRI